MKAIRQIFAKPIDRRIEEVIKVDQADEQTVYEELQEYVVTRSIGEHFLTVYKAIADAQAEPHEGIGVWVSGFFGSGKSSFAKILGYTVAGRRVMGKLASDILKEKAGEGLPEVKAEMLASYLDFINTRIPTHAVIFDVSMDRGVRYASERITEIMYKALLRELGYPEDFDLAELEIALETDGRLEEFKRAFEDIHQARWEERRKLPTFALSEASVVLHKLHPDQYPSPDSWARTIGEQGRADISAKTLAERAFELTARRKPGHALIFVIDEVGQYVSRSEEKMLDLQAVVQAFGIEGKNRVTRRQAVAPCWIVVTSQEKLNEIVDALGSRRIELARLQDRFPYAIDLKQSDISEVASKRVLGKNPTGYEILAQLYDQHEGRLKELCRLERTGRNVAITKSQFIELYPYLPYQIDLSIDIVSGLRLKRGAHRHIGGSNRTIIKQAQQVLIHPRTDLASKPIGHLVTLDLIYELLEAGNLLPTETTREIDDIPRRLPGDEMALKVGKAIALLEVVTDLPRTAHNLAVVLHPRVDADSILPDVQEALKRLEAKQIIRESEEGYKLLSLQEKNWDDERRQKEPRPAERRQIRNELLKQIFEEPGIRGYRYKGFKAFMFDVKADGETLIAGNRLPLEILTADDATEFEERCDEARRRSQSERNVVFWVFPLNDELHNLTTELFRSQQMIAEHERLAAQGRLSREETACLSDEVRRADRYRRELRKGLEQALASGAGFFRGVRKDGSSLGNTLPEILAALRDAVIPDLYPKFEMGNRPVRGDEAEKVLKETNLTGLPSVFYEPPDGLGLIRTEGGKSVPNLSAPICQEILAYLRQQHSYGNSVTGKDLARHFGGLGYGWDQDILRLVLATLLRGGAIEVTYQGRKYRSHTDPACQPAFTRNDAFRSAVFAPREAMGVKVLAGAARRYEAITGKEVQVDEAAIARAFQELARADWETILQILPQMRALGLAGTSWLQQFQQTVEAVLQMQPDDCVKTLYGEGETYKENHERVQKLKGALTEATLELLKRAKRVAHEELPVLESRETPPDVVRLGRELRQVLGSEWWVDQLEVVRKATEAVHVGFCEVYERLHARRQEVYEAAVDEVKGLPEWAQIEQDQGVAEETKHAVLKPLTDRLCSEEGLPEDASVCPRCRSTVGQMESEISAVDRAKSEVIQALQKLAAPEKKIVRVRLSTLLPTAVETENDVESTVNRLREHLLRQLGEDVRVVLEW